jgi:hypothetical protein
MCFLLQMSRRILDSVSAISPGIKVAGAENSQFQFTDFQIIEIVDFLSMLNIRLSILVPEERVNAPFTSRY